MKKSLFYLSIAAMAFGLTNANFNKNFISEFVDCGYDAICENTKAVKLNAADASNLNNGANKNAGNTATAISSKIASQFGVNSAGQNCVRFIVAIPSLSVEVVFNRTLTKSNGSISYGQVVAKSAYESIKSSGTNLVLPESWNNQFAGADYNYFAIYTLAGIPDTEKNAKIEISATITEIDNEEENNSSAPLLQAPKENKSVEVYNSASFLSLQQKDQAIDISTLEVGSNGKLVEGQTITDPITKNQYTVDSNGNLKATTANVSSGDLIIISSVFVKDGDTIIEVPVVSVGANFTKNIGDKTASIIIPNTVKTLDKDAFKGLNHPKSIVYDGTAEEWETLFNKSAFMNSVSDNITIVLNDGAEHTFNMKTGKFSN